MIKVLLVEDTATFRAIIRHQLLALTVREVVVAANGQEALKLLTDHGDIDAIISDWHMEPMDGLQFCATVQRSPQLKGRRMPVIFMTSDAKLADAEIRARAAARARDLGIVDILPKPFSPEQLRAALSKAVGMRL